MVVDDSGDLSGAFRSVVGIAAAAFIAGAAARSGSRLINSQPDELPSIRVDEEYSLRPPLQQATRVRLTQTADEELPTTAIAPFALDEEGIWYVRIPTPPKTPTFRVEEELPVTAVGGTFALFEDVPQFPRLSVPRFGFWLPSENEYRQLLPSDFAGLIAWHEADSQSQGSGVAVPFAVGVGGKPDSQTQATSSKQPTIYVNPVSGRKAFRFDAVDDSIILAASTAITAVPLTTFVVYAPRTIPVGGYRRTLAGDYVGAGHNWLIGCRQDFVGSGELDAYAEGWIRSPQLGVAGQIDVHVLRQPAAGNALYRINGAQVASAAVGGVPGVMAMGVIASGAFTEPADSDIYALAIYNTYLSDAEVLALETYFSEFQPDHDLRATQAVIEPWNEAGGLVTTQAVIEQSYEAGGLRTTQAVIEQSYEAGGVVVSQICIELYYDIATGGKRFRAQVMG